MTSASPRDAQMINTKSMLLVAACPNEGDTSLCDSGGKPQIYLCFVGLD